LDELNTLTIMSQCLFLLNITCDTLQHMSMVDLKHYIINHTYLNFKSQIHMNWLALQVCPKIGYNYTKQHLVGSRNSNYVRWWVPL